MQNNTLLTNLLLFFTPTQATTPYGKLTESIWKNHMYQHGNYMDITPGNLVDFLKRKPGCIPYGISMKNPNGHYAYIIWNMYRKDTIETWIPYGNLSKFPLSDVTIWKMYGNLIRNPQGNFIIHEVSIQFTYIIHMGYRHHPLIRMDSILNFPHFSLL